MGAEELMQQDDHEQPRREPRVENGNTTMAAIVIDTAGMVIAEDRGKSKVDGDCELVPSEISETLTEEDYWEAAPDEYKCPLEMCLLTDDPVVASDGFMYSKKGLERWIAHCESKGRPLTSPKTGEAMDAAFMINKTHRTLRRRSE